ncbi:hypothetical protein NST21_15210 [Peribacillus sp. FSL K6-1552]|uniref:hypothetical protein n=1 Tax=Peribacillus sp. FSL K6-1552 TaxID=2954514 RepID=UPI0030F683F4
MFNFKKCIFTLLFLVAFFFVTINDNAGAVTRAYQDVTCYLANPASEKPSQQGYNYAVGTTAASQLSIRGNTASKPKIPYGSRVTFHAPVNVIGYGNISSLTIRDTGDPNWTKTSYFVDVYYGNRSSVNESNCWNKFGSQKRDVSY